MNAINKKKTKLRPNRLDYLNLLVVEFQNTKSKDARLQTLANLANFAYDPCNYYYLRKLNVVDIFLNHLFDIDETIIQFSIAGLCNLCLDPENKEYILKNNGVKIIVNLLKHRNENILLSAITTLMYLVTPESKEEITDIGNIKFMINLSHEKNHRLKNLAEIFLQDYCSEEKIKASQDFLMSLQNIPLPISQ